MKCLSNFGTFTDGALENKCHVIINSLTGNASFPNPVPALATIEAASTAYSASLVEAGTGNRAAIALKNMRRAELTELLAQLCMCVNFLGNGQPELLLTTGFDVSKERVPTVITVPQNLQVENGENSGQLLLSVTRVKGAASYLYEYTTDSTLAPNTWVATSASKSKLKFSNLLPGTVYYCRVGAVGPYGQLLYSPVLSRMVI